MNVSLSSIPRLYCLLVNPIPSQLPSTQNLSSQLQLSTTYTTYRIPLLPLFPSTPSATASSPPHRYKNGKIRFNDTGPCLYVRPAVQVFYQTTHVIPRRSCSLQSNNININVRITSTNTQISRHGEGRLLFHRRPPDVPNTLTPDTETHTHTHVLSLHCFVSPGLAYIRTPLSGYNVPPASAWLSQGSRSPRGERIDRTTD